MKKNYEKISCPYCKSENALPFRKSADIVNCFNCNTIYLRTRLKKDAMQDLYQSYNSDAPQMCLPKNEDEIKNSVLRRDYWIREIISYTKSKENILDIGCGWGAFLDNARSYGFNPRGIEITKIGAEFSKKKLKINSTSNQFLDTEFEKDSFSVITMNHVLEHLPEPKEALDKVYEILEPGGLFCGIVPNINSLCSKFLTDHWEWLDANYHYVHYYPENLEKNLKKAGFIIEKIYTASGDYNRKQLSEIIQKFFRPVSEELYNEVITSIEKEGLGEEIRFIVRKPFAETENEKRRELRVSNLRRYKNYKISIIIPVFNKVEYTAKCLETIYSIDNGIKDFEVIVVNNNSTDETKDFLNFALELYPDLKVIENEKNLKFAGACNIGAKNSEGKVLVFLNNDTVPTEGWLSFPINQLIINPEVGIVGSKLLYPDKTIQHAGIEFIPNFHPLYPLWPVHRFLSLPEDEELANKTEYVDVVTGASLFISKALFNEVEGFSEEYGMYFEDSDLCFKVMNKGKRILYEPKSVLYHFEGKSNNDETQRHFQNLKAAEIFFSKWDKKIDEMSRERGGEKLLLKNLNNISIQQIQSIEMLKRNALKFLANNRIGEAENIISKIRNKYPQYPQITELTNLLNEIKGLPESDIITKEVNRTSSIYTKTKEQLKKISIIVPLFNNVSFTKIFINSLEYTDLNYELILIDNSSTDETSSYLNMISENNKRIKIISNKTNLGFPKAINQGFRAASGELLIVANNDIIFTNGSLNRMQLIAESDPAIGIVGPISNSVSGVQLDKNAKYNSIEEMHKYADKISEKNKGKVLIFPRVAFLCTLIKKEVIEKIGGLDERFSPGNFEDDDFCLRAQLAGFKTVVAQDVFIHHYGSKSFKADGEDKYAERLKINRQKFVDKWGADPNEIWLKGKSIKNNEIFIPLYEKDKVTQKFNEAARLIEEKNYEESLKILEELLSAADMESFESNNLNYEDILNLAGNVAFLKGDLELAQKYFEDELKLNPESSRACTSLGEFFFSAGVFEAAKTMFEWGIKNDPSNKNASAGLRKSNIQLNLPEDNFSLQEDLVNN